MKHVTTRIKNKKDNDFFRCPSVEDILLEMSVDNLKSGKYEPLKSRQVRTKNMCESRMNTGLNGNCSIRLSQPNIYINSFSCLSTDVSVVYYNGSKYHSIRLTLPDRKKSGNPVMTRVDTFEILSTSHFFWNLYFGIPLYKSFKCVLPGHHGDSVHSARFEEMEDGKVVYHCYDCDKRLDFINFIEIFTGKGYLGAMKILFDITGSNLETDWQREKRLEMAAMQDYIIRTLPKDYPKLYSYLIKSNLVGFYIDFIGIVKAYLCDVSIVGSDKFLFIMGSCKLAEIMTKMHSEITPTICLKKIKRLSRLGLINIIPDKEIPYCLLRPLRNYMKEHQYNYRASVYEVPPFTASLFMNANDIILSDSKRNVRISKYSKLTEAYVNGVDAAKDIYVQSKDKEFKSKSAEKFYGHMKIKVVEFIQSNGYTTEKELLAAIKGFSKANKTKYSYILLPKLLEELNLERTLVNNELRQEFNISQGDLRNSKIIYKKSVL